MIQPETGTTLRNATLGDLAGQFVFVDPPSDLTPAQAAARDGDLARLQTMPAGVLTSVNEGWDGLSGGNLANIAARHGQVDTLRWLIERRISLEMETSLGSHPLHDAAYYGHLGCVNALLEAGANVNARDLTQRTPAHHAVIGRHPDVLRALLAGGADRTAIDSSSLMSPSQLAVRVRAPEAILALLSDPAEQVTAAGAGAGVPPAVASGTLRFDDPRFIAPGVTAGEGAAPGPATAPRDKGSDKCCGCSVM